MREIEFRGIDIKTKQFVYGSLVDFSKLNNCPQFEIYSFDEITKEQTYYKVYGVGQYTGLKDKNGVKIYEGDIIHVGDSNIKYVIEWNDNGFMGRGVRAKGNKIGLTYWQDRIVTLGNIHQNPELLESR